MTTNPPPDARNARIYVATANVAVMDILSGREQSRRAAQSAEKKKTRALRGPGLLCGAGSPS